MRQIVSQFLLLALCLGAQAPAFAQAVKVEAAWVRASVPGQSATGGFMRLTSTQPMRLVGVASPAAQVAEIHEMKMDGEVMRMRAVPGIDLPAGQTVELKPGGYHLMLQSLRAPLADKGQVSLQLQLLDAQGKRHTQTLQVPVRSQPPLR